MTLSFSQRIGLEPAKKAIQSDDIDESLRTGLWNALLKTVFYRLAGTEITGFGGVVEVVRSLWEEFFVWRRDALPVYGNVVQAYIQEVYFKLPWNKVYDFIQFVAQHTNDRASRDDFVQECNRILERESSAYRFVGDTIVPVTNQQEIEEIEKALRASDMSRYVSSHIERALGALTNRQNPNTRESIKESISAVEAVCALIVGDPKATLGKALDKINTKIQLHPAFKTALDKLYGYTSDAQGIRHALLDEPSLDVADARFMLVSCSAFANYLTAKASDAGLKLTVPAQTAKP